MIDQQNKEDWESIVKSCDAMLMAISPSSYRSVPSRWTRKKRRERWEQVEQLRLDVVAAAKRSRSIAQQNLQGGIPKSTETDKLKVAVNKWHAAL